MDDWKGFENPKEGQEQHKGGLGLRCFRLEKTDLSQSPDVVGSSFSYFRGCFGCGFSLSYRATTVEVKLC